VQAELARLDPAALRRAAASAPPEGASADPRLRAVSALAEGLGLADPEAVAEAVAVVATAYFGTDDPAVGAGADAAVAWLLPRVLDGGERPVRPVADDTAFEAAANRIGLLVQACDATGTLVAHAEKAAPSCPRPPAAEPPGPEPLAAETPGAGPLPAEPLPSEALRSEALLAETLRHDPPVRTMRRVAARATRVAGVEIAEGDLVLLDIAAANRDPEFFAAPGSFEPRRSGPPALTFGAAPRVCPGRAHALALAAGLLERAARPGG
jgi:hypothetical protein